MWRSILGLSVVPGAVSFIAALRFIPENPRFLSFVGRYNEGVKVRGGSSTLLQDLFDPMSA